ncbi:MAG TPA: hypothetical protein VFD85_06970 [Gemmatimonadales bacterium]|nr:hypothetical protein [Gemmatimonadales bacterium]
MSARGMGRHWARTRILLAGVLGAACSNAGADRILTIPGQAQVSGFIYLDRNGNGIFDGAAPGDTALVGAKVRLIAKGTVDTVALVTSDVGALVGGNPVNLKFGPVTVGSYRVVVDTLTIPHDSMRVAQIDSVVSATPGSTPYVQIGISFPAVTATAARALPLRTKVFLVGVALADANTFGDSTNSFADASGAIRVTQIKPTTVVGVGDSDRVLGTVDTLGGQRVLRAVSVFQLTFGATTPITTLTVGQAKTANGGVADAALVTFSGRLVILDTATGPAGRIIHVKDTTASLIDTLELHLDSTAIDSVSMKRDTVGARLHFRGILFPSSVPGRWLLKPRAPADQF